MSATVTPPKQPPVFNLPNQLTAARLVLGIVLFVFIEREEWIWSIGIFALAAFTDWLDGYLARLQGLVSTLGRNLDPLVDKVVVCGAYIFLLRHTPALTPWMVVIVVSRELLITGLRGFMENLGATFGADWLGKIKMVLQCGALLAIFVALQEGETDDKNTILHWVRDITIWSIVIATTVSGLQYLWRAFALLKK
jgi:CDP-diacylglycerol---glycerol-3-phosphate 3-phosphatidyltransferase